VEVDEFTERLARVRQRFVSSLHGKVDDSYMALTKLSEKDASAIETLVVTHRKLHEMCGIAPSIGFPATGIAARAAEAVLREPAKSRRPLTTKEVAILAEALDRLRAVTQSELQPNNVQG